MKNLSQVIECDSSFFENLSKEQVEKKIQRDIPKENVWLRIVGSLELSNAEYLLSEYNLHHITVDNLLTFDHLVKYESNHEYTQIMVRIINLDKDGDVEPIQLSIIIGDNFIISLEEIRIDFMEEYFHQIRHQHSEISCKMIAYDILDRLIDDYMDHIHSYQNKLDAFEDSTIDSTGEYDLDTLFSLKREIYAFRRVLRPVIDVIDKMAKPYVNQSNEEFIHIKDLQDHARKLTGSVEYMIDVCNNLQVEIFTNIQYKLNKTMSLMTAVTLIFSPLMVITGIYGMNFVNMPELNFKYSYPIVLLVMFITAIGLVIFFKRRKIIDK